MEPMITKLISVDSVENLESQAFASVLNALLTAEADYRNVSLADLDLTLRINDADAGIDGRINWPKEVEHNVLVAGENVVQYKSGELTIPQLVKEFGKPGVQTALSRKAHYVLFVGRSYVKRSRETRATKLKSLCEAAGIDPGLCIIRYGDQIARWISRFPSVVIRPELSLGYPAFVTVEQWQQQKNLTNAFKPDKARNEIIVHLRTFVSAPSINNVVRIEGPAGVGKTRLVLEALKIPGKCERSLYCPNAGDPHTQELLTLIQGNPTASAIVVVDECERDRQELLCQFADLAAGRIRLICVGPAEVLAPSPILVNVFKVLPLGDEEIRAILSDMLPGAPPEVTETAVRLASGYVKLATFVSLILAEHPDLPLTDFPKIDNVQHFLKRFVDISTYKALKTLSLLTRVGWNDEVRSEAEILAAVVGIDFQDLQVAVKQLSDRGVVLARGFYLYVTPDLLAISAAASLWDERSPELVTVVAQLPAAAREQMLRRLATMRDHPPVKVALKRLLSENGLFKNLEDLNKELLSEVFRFLASALPEASVAALERLLGPATGQELLDFKTGRRDVVFAIESLLRWPETSLRAALVLKRLALAENESFGNSATGVFAGYFQAFLSGSPIPLEDRLELLWDLVKSDDPTSRQLAVKGASAALAFQEHRMGGDVDDVSNRRFPPDWRPHNWGQLWDGRRIAIRQLSAIAEGSDGVASEAREALIHSVFTLTRHGPLEEAVRILKEFRPSNDKEKRESLEAAQRLRREAAEWLNDHESERMALDHVIDSVFGTSYFDRVRRWIGRRLPSDFDATSPTGFDKVDTLVRQLADEGFRRGLSQEEQSWLASPEAENVWSFGLRLGELDNGRTLINTIIAVSPTDLNCLFLASYLVGIATSQGDPVRERILDDLAERQPALAFAATWRGTPTVASGERMACLIENEQVDPAFYRALTYGAWVTSLPEKLCLRIISLILTHDPAVTVEPALSMLQHYTQKNPDRFGAASQLVWRALEITPLMPRGHLEWEWGELAQRATPHDPLRMARLILDRIQRGERLLLPGDSSLNALSDATKLAPEAVWNEVAPRLLSSELQGFRLRHALDKWFGELVPVDLLVAWAEQNQPKGPAIVAHLVTIAAPLSDCARALVEAFPENDQVLRVFAGSLETGAWAGPISGHMEGLQRTVDQWKTDPNARIRSWAQRLSKSLDERLERQRLIEEGEGL
jgi:hypothetical protein